MMTNKMNANTPLVAPSKTPLLHKILIMISIITFVGGGLTGVMTYMNVGYGAHFYNDWISSFLLAVTIMAPIGLIMMALANMLVKNLLPNSSELKKNLVISVFMAIIMESLMAFITAANNIGFAEHSEFIAAWLEGLLAALPIGLTIMLTMSVTVKPKLEKFLKS